MVLEDFESLLTGESDRIEYKASRPKDAKKYLKTVVAFANSHGDSIIFGVDDAMHEVVGVPDEDVFDEMDAIANAVSDAITPTVVPGISLRQIQDKTTIVVDVPKGRQVPYYLKSDGFEHGVYTRVGATSRPAELDYVREIMVENSPQGFDRMPNRDVELTEEGVAALCARMRDVARAHTRDDAERAAVKDVTQNQLLKWGVLVKRDGRLLPTNAYALLSGEGCEFTWKVQCGIFRGTDRVVFLDRREFDGSVIDQIENAYQYVLSKINMGANFDHLVRRDEYEIPMWPIRELITNAVLHRSYLAASSAQVCLYDDRLEISSPGGLKRGITLDEALTGQSEIRNRALALAFQYMKLIENWGTGLMRARREILDFGLREPEFVVSDSMFRVNIYRMGLEEFGEKLHPTHGNTTVNVPDNKGTTDNNSDNKDTADNKSDNKGGSSDITRKLLELLSTNPDITQAQIMEQLGVARSTITSRLAELQKKGIVRRIGARKNGRWEVLGE